MWDAVLTWTDWAQALGPVRALRVSSYAYPLVNAAHIIGLALLFGAIAVADVGILREGRYDAADHGPAIRIAIAGFALAATTGLILFAVRASAYAQNPFMWGKLALIAVAGANAFGLRQLARRQQRISLLERTAAVSSLAIWIGAIVSGRMIGFL
jgi:hypothetical protein